MAKPRKSLSLMRLYKLAAGHARTKKQLEVITKYLRYVSDHKYDDI